MRLQASFQHKPSDFGLNDVIVEQTVRLTSEEFAQVLCAPLRDSAFIEAHAERMYRDEEGHFHCLLLTAEGRSDGLLVESEGYGYCRYASYIPNALGMDSPTLRTYSERLTAAVGYILRNALQESSEKKWCVGNDKLAEETGFAGGPESAQLLLDMLRERPELEGAMLLDDAIHVSISPAFCPTAMHITQEEASFTMQL